jgi:hypothetical protein
MNGYIFIRRCIWLLVLLLCLPPAMAIADTESQPPTTGKVMPALPAPDENATAQRNAGGIAPSHPTSATGAGGMADIHDIKPIIIPKAFPWAAVWIAAAALVLIALLALGRFLWKKRRGTGEIPTLTPELPPEENARLALSALAGERIVDGRRFYFRLSEILRRYLLERYGIGAPEMTPEELQPLVARLDLPAGQLGVLTTFWTHSEPVKFAGRAALETEMTDDLEQVRRFVAVTTEAAQLAEAAATATDGGSDGPPPPPPGRRED